MPLPTIDLDTRRYPDLVDEAQSLIPRYAPGWTNENASDPGITILELLAFLTEQLIYRANRIPERHRRKFVQLVGVTPEPPRPARVALAFTPGAGGDGLMLPAGVVVAAGAIPFRTLAPLTLTAAALAAVQVFDGLAFTDATTALLAHQPVQVFGADPTADPSAPIDEQRALYLGFDAALPSGRDISLAVTLAGQRSGADERTRIEAEAAAAAIDCGPHAFPSCDDDTAAPTPAQPVAPLVHHAVRTAWDVFDSTGWRALGNGSDSAPVEVVDDTRGFTLDGSVLLHLTAPTVATTVGSVATPLHYVRCRLIAGAPDETPLLLGVAPNAIVAEQRTPARETITIPAGTTAPAAAPVKGTTARLELDLAADGTIVSLETGGTDTPEALVLDYVAATGAAPGSLSVTLRRLGAGSGAPEQWLLLPGAPVAGGEASLWSLEPGGSRTWSAVADFDAATAGSDVFVLDSDTGAVSFGDGRRGRVPPAGAPLLGSYDLTRGAAGNVAPGAGWTFAGADDDLNAAILGADPTATGARIASIANAFAASGGSEAETLSHAAARAAARLWSHERLVELAADADTGTLDQLDHATVLDRTAPPRAASLLDFERLALDVPGTRVARARAFGGIDGRYAGLVAPGTVTVAIVAGVPRRAPVPTQALLDAIAAFLRRRKTLGTRLVVVGPTYVEVTVDATLVVGSAANPARVQADALEKLVGYLDPITGGPSGRGWPFGRDVYRSEMLQLLDGVDGVDHVSSLELVDPGGSSCGNVCIPATGLPLSGAHTIEVSA